MKAGHANSRRRDYPHVITRGPHRHTRWPMLISNAPVASPRETYVFIGHGYMIGDRLTDTGRRAILSGMQEKARKSKSRYCVVWSPHDCTYLDGQGGLRDGTMPPRGDMVTDANDQAPIRLEDVWTIALPPRRSGQPFSSHLCVRRIGPVVEISLGAPLVLADFCDDEPDATLVAAHHDADGRWKLPFSFRGVTVTATGADGRILYGPVQPQGEVPSIMLRDPWPEQLEAACHEVAGRRLSMDLIDKAWRTINPEDTTMNFVGVLQAA